MIQEILVIIIVVAAVFFAGFKIYKRFRVSENPCEGCITDCTGCNLPDLKKEIEEKKESPGDYFKYS